MSRPPATTRWPIEDILARTDLAALRVVVKMGFTHDMADLLVKDIERQLPHRGEDGMRREPTAS